MAERGLSARGVAYGHSRCEIPTAPWFLCAIVEASAPRAPFDSAREPGVWWSLFSVSEPTDDTTRVVSAFCFDRGIGVYLSLPREVSPN